MGRFARRGEWRCQPGVSEVRVEGADVTRCEWSLLGQVSNAGVSSRLREHKNVGGKSSWIFEVSERGIERVALW